MPEGYVSPEIARLIDEHLMAQTGTEIGDLEDWLLMSNRIQPEPVFFDDFFDDPADFEDIFEDAARIA